MKIDTHHHFWRYNPREYSWIDEPQKAIRRDFLPEHLKPELDTAGVDGVVTVQGRQTLEETAMLLDLAAQHGFVRGIVGWVPLISPAVAGDLERFSGNPWLKSVRHVLQDELDGHYMLRSDFNRGIRAVTDTGLVYDILIYARHLAATIEFVDQHPNQVFVLNHIAKPRIREGELEPWRTLLTELARRPNVYCKLSAVPFQADWQTWTLDQLKPFVEVVLTAFGPNRLMFGSDWPVCLPATSYQRWADAVERLIAQLSGEDQERIWSGTAVEAYKL